MPDNQLINVMAQAIFVVVIEEDSCVLWCQYNSQYVFVCFWCEKSIGLRHVFHHAHVLD